MFYEYRRLDFSSTNPYENQDPYFLPQNVSKNIRKSFEICFLRSQQINER